MPRPPPMSGRGLLPIRGHQRAHAVGLLRALADPIVDTREIQLQLRLGAPGYGIEKTHVLKAQATLPLTAVGHDHVIERLVARPASRQAYGYHSKILSFGTRPGDTRPKKSAD